MLGIAAATGFRTQWSAGIDTAADIGAHIPASKTNNKDLAVQRFISSGNERGEPEPLSVDPQIRHRIAIKTEQQQI
jgi:hypothetical protein